MKMDVGPQVMDVLHVFKSVCCVVSIALTQLFNWCELSQIKCFDLNGKDYWMR